MRLPSRRRMEVLAGLVGVGLLGNAYRSLAQNQRVAHMLRYDQSFAAMGLRLRTWVLGLGSLLGLAGMIRLLHGPGRAQSNTPSARNRSCSADATPSSSPSTHAVS